MTETIVVALITGGLALIGTVMTGIVSNNRNNREMDHRLELHNAVIDTRLESLTEEVRKHNNLIERTFKLEEHNVVQDEKISVLGDRVDELKRQVEKHHG